MLYLISEIQRLYSIQVDNTLVTNKTSIVNNFNDYFSNVGPNLAELRPISPCDGSYKDNMIKDNIINHYCINQNMFMLPTDEREIISVVSNLKANKSAEFDNLSPAIVKCVIDAIAQPLTCICNLSMLTGMKTTKVCPIFKSKDKCEVKNYRPISVVCYLY